MACLPESVSALCLRTEAVMDDFREENEQTYVGGSRSQAAAPSLFLISWFSHLIEISTDFSLKL